MKIPSNTIKLIGEVTHKQLTTKSKIARHLGCDPAYLSRCLAAKDISVKYLDSLIAFVNEVKRKDITRQKKANLLKTA